MNDQGTPDLSDDVVMGGATFAFYVDDGNGIFEPETADAPVLATIEAPNGFAVFTPPGPGDYWVVEVAAPPDMDIAPPQLVTYVVPPAPLNCVIDLGRSACAADEDASGGYLVVVVSNSPTGGVDPTSGELTQPPTDVLMGAREAPTPGLPLVVLGVTSLAVGLLVDLRRRSRGSRRPK